MSRIVDFINNCSVDDDSNLPYHIDADKINLPKRTFTYRGDKDKDWRAACKWFAENRSSIIFKELKKAKRQIAKMKQNGHWKG